MEKIGNILRARMTNCPSASEQSFKKKSAVERLNELEGHEPYYDCPVCRNKGKIFYEKDGYEFCRDCECMKIRRSYERIELSGMKDILTRYTFETYEAAEEWQKALKAKAERFAKNPEKFFYMGGQVGIGKTHLCTAIVKELLNSGNEVRYMQWRDDVVKIKRNVNSDAYDQLIEPFKKVKVLYIDDLFKVKEGEQPTPADVNIAFEILNHRYLNDGYITVISSEKTGRELIEIDEAVGSRIVEMAGTYFINIGNDKKKNYRLREIM